MLFPAMHSLLVSNRLTIGKFEFSSFVPCVQRDSKVTNVSIMETTAYARMSIYRCLFVMLNIFNETDETDETLTCLVS